MSENKTSYYFQMNTAPNEGKATSEAWISDDLRQGLDHGLRQAELNVPGLGKVLGGGLRPIVEGGGAAALKTGIAHSASGKSTNGSGDIQAVALPKI